MTYDDAVAFWYGRINYETRSAQPQDLKLERMRELLLRLGRPDAGLPCVHIAGTKGKGSTAAMLAAILQAAGHRVGLFTSPHLIHVEERIQVDGEPIPKNTLAELIGVIAPHVRTMDAALPPEPTFFEIITALAFLHFDQEKVDIAIFEVGLGGRFDSTNVCTPLVSVITSIGLDHMAQLGDTVEKIAFEKAGIIKRGVPCVSGVMEPGPRGVITAVAKAVDAPLFEVSANYSAALSLPGDHQRRNAALAVETVTHLRRAGVAIPDSAMKTGLKTVAWPARVQVLSRNPTVVLDCAHNVPSAEALVQTLKEIAPDAARKHCVFAVSNDKQFAAMLGILAGYFDEFHFTQYSHNPRCVPPESLVPLLAGQAAASVTVPAGAALATAPRENFRKRLALCDGFGLSGRGVGCYIKPDERSCIIMTVTLPETMRDELVLKSKSAGFRDVDTYVAYLVVADDGDGVDEFADADFAIPDEIKNDFVREPRTPRLANSL